MNVRPKVIIAIVLFAVGLAGCAVFLTGQGLDRAEKWVSLVGVIVSVAIGAAGLGVGWATWRQAQNAPATPVVAGGAGAIGIGGDNHGAVRTEVSGVTPGTTAPVSGSGGVHAPGTGSVAIGGNSTASVTTHVTGRESRGTNP